MPTFQCLTKFGRVWPLFNRRHLCMFLDLSKDWPIRSLVARSTDFGQTRINRMCSGNAIQGTQLDMSESDMTLRLLSAASFSRGSNTSVKEHSAEANVRVGCLLNLQYHLALWSVSLSQAGSSNFTCTNENTWSGTNETRRVEGVR